MHQCVKRCQCTSILCYLGVILCSVCVKRCQFESISCQNIYRSRGGNWSLSPPPAIRQKTPAPPGTADTPTYSIWRAPRGRDEAPHHLSHSGMWVLIVTPSHTHTLTHSLTLVHSPSLTQLTHTCTLSLTHILTSSLRGGPQRSRHS